MIGSYQHAAKIYQAGSGDCQDCGAVVHGRSARCVECYRKSICRKGQGRRSPRDFYELVKDTLLSRRPYDRMMVSRAFAAGVRGIILLDGETN